MQLPCQCRKFRTRRGTGALAALYLLLALPGNPVEANPVRTPDEALMTELRSWVSTQKAAAQGVEALPLDRRVQVARCEPGWTFDFPFSSAEVVRARCSTIGAQLYVRMRQGAPAAPGISSAAPPDRTAAVRESPPGAIPRAEEPSRSRSVLVARTGLARGTRLAPDMVQMAEAGDGRPAPGFLGDSSSVIDMEVTRDLRPGEALRPSDIRPATLVRRGEVVTLELVQMQGLSIRARVEALHDGRRGETVRLINRESGKTVTGVVVGVNQAEAR